MDDLISRAAAIEYMKSTAGCATCDSYSYVRCRACSWDDAMNIVEELPAVDAVPMVHGRWEPDDTYKALSFSRCSACKEVYICTDWLTDGSWRFCPNCGAKMDGGYK